MYRYLIIIEQGNQNYSAYVPDLPGCIATGKTIEEVEANMRGAIEMHIEGMLEEGLSVPVPSLTAEYLEVSVPHSAA